MITIFEELVKITHFQIQQPGEPDNDYLKNLVTSVSKLPDNQFWKLSGPAQNWFNNAASSYTTLKTIPDCPGFKEQQKNKVDIKPVIAGRIQSVAPNIGNTPKAKVVVAKTPEAVKIKKNPGVMDAIRRCVILHPDWTTRKVYQYLKENGWPTVNLNTVAIDGGNIRRVIDLAREMGFWLDANYQRVKELTEGIAIEAEADKTASA